MIDVDYSCSYLGFMRVEFQDKDLSARRFRIRMDMDEV